LEEDFRIPRRNWNALEPGDVITISGEILEYLGGIETQSSLCILSCSNCGILEYLGGIETCSYPWEDCKQKTDFRIPRRNWNYHNLRFMSTPFSDFRIPRRNWNISRKVGEIEKDGRF